MRISSARSPLWNVPYQRNQFFTGREKILSQLYQALRTENTVALSHPQGISGLGGIGKTQAALEYAYRYYAEYNAVLWVRADSATTLTSGFVDLAHLLEIPERNEQDQNIIVEAVQRWLRRNPGWLLIFDNMDDLSVAEPFLPKAGPGHLLFITRAHTLGGLTQRLEVQQMEPETGALLLLRRAGFLPLQAIRDRATSNDRIIACDISQELDGLPLAIDQAGAYIKETPCLLIDYLALYRTRRQDLPHARGGFDQNYPASVATTWSLSFEKVGRTNPAAAELLNFCAFLAPHAIPEAMIIEGAPHLGNVLAPVVTDPVQLDLVCKEVLKYSLFQRGADIGTLTIHRLVQAVLQDNLPSETRMHWKQRAVLAINTAFPSSESFDHWPSCERYLPHALLCTQWIEQGEINSGEAAHLLHEMAYYLTERGQYAQAEPLYQRSLTICEQLFGAEHELTAQVLRNFGYLSIMQRHDAMAESLLQRAFKIQVRLLGLEHDNVSNTIEDIAYVYKCQGKYSEAEQFYQYVLKIRQQQLGLNHPSVAIGLNNLT